MTANERQVGGDHYRKKGTEIQHWDYAEMKGYDKFQYVITKYVERWRDKNGIVDLEKALHYLEKYIEVEKLKPQALTYCLKRKTELRPFPIRKMPPKVQRLEERLPDLTGQKHPFGWDKRNELGNPIADFEL